MHSLWVLFLWRTLVIWGLPQGTRSPSSSMGVPGLSHWDEGRRGACNLPLTQPEMKITSGEDHCQPDVTQTAAAGLGHGLPWQVRSVGSQTHQHRLSVSC